MSENITQLYSIEKNIKKNLESIEKLVEEAQSLKDSINSLSGTQKEVMEKHLHTITGIIEMLAAQTIDMFSAFREFVK